MQPPERARERKQISRTLRITGGAARGAAAGAATGAWKIPKFSQLRGSGVAWLPFRGETGGPKEPPGRSPAGAGAGAQPPDPSREQPGRERRKPKIPTTGRISARISQIDAPFGPAGSPARVWLKSAVGSARRSAKVALREKGHSFPALHEKSYTKRGKPIPKSGGVRTGNQPIGAFSHQSRGPNER